MSSDDLSLTLIYASTGTFDNVLLPPTSSLSHLLEMSAAILGLPGRTVDHVLLHNGSVLYAPGIDIDKSLEASGLKNGDMIVLGDRRGSGTFASPSSSSSRPSYNDLDFSSILEGSTTSTSLRSSAAVSNPWSAMAPVTSVGGGLDFSTLLHGSRTSLASVPTVSFPGMSLDDAINHNSDPERLVQLLFDPHHSQLLKEMNYHTPLLARSLIEAHKNGGIKAAVNVWRQSIMQGMVSGTIGRMNDLKKEADMRKKMNCGDEEAKNYFEDKKKKAKVDEQYRRMVEEFPESLGRVLMLYINTTLNGIPVQAFVDSGAQNTILSEKAAKKCGLFELIDTRFAGVAVGVGTGKILGRIHLAPLQIGPHFFQCSITVMEGSGLGDKNMEFLFGLDMLRRHKCKIDLELNALVLVIARAQGGGPDEHYLAPFLHEHDLDETKGGTLGFDADRANKELEELQKKSGDATGDTSRTKEKERSGSS